MRWIRPHKPWSFLALAVLASVAIAALSVFIVWQLRLESRRLAESTVLNTAQVMAQRIESSLEDLDRQLQVMAQRFRDADRLPQRDLERLFDEVRAELPLYRAALRFVVTDQQGNQRFSSARPKGQTTPLPNLADRQYFQKASQGETSLLFEGPVQAKLDGTWSIVLARRIAGSDGQFQGVVAAVVPVAHLGQGFDKVDLGADGVLNLRTLDLAQVVRYPALQGPNQEVGNRNVSATIRELIASQPGAHQHVYRTVAPIDGGERVYAYKRFERMPFWMTVGLSTQNYQKGWRGTAWWLGLSNVAFALLLLWGARRLDRQNANLSQAVQDRTQALERLQREQKAILETATVGLLHLRAGRVVWANPAYADLVGCTPEELVGQPVESLYADGPMAQAGVASAIAQGRANKGVYRLQTRMRTRQGELRDIEVTGRYFDVEARDSIGAVRDITMELAHARAMDQALEAAQAGERAKSQFLATVSHEIRTPLNWVMGMLQVLAMEDGLSPEMKGQIDTAMRGGELLLAVLNDVLDYSGLADGRTRLQVAPMRLTDSLASFQDLIDHLPANPAVSVRVEVDPRLSLRVLADARRLDQILLNLVSNAVKFTEAGTVRLSASQEALSEQAMDVSFRVQDTGIGMSEATLAKLYTPFMQADGSDTRRYGGTGLGLAITKGLVEVMGGSISVLSQLGVGTVFTVRLRLPLADKLGAAPGAAPLPPAASPAYLEPLQRPDLVRMLSIAEDSARRSQEASRPAKDAETEPQVAPSTQPNVATQKPLSGCVVLVVDDDMGNVATAQALLRSVGARAVAAYDGMSAVRLLRKHPEPIDVVLMDLQMTDLDGLDTTRMIRNDPEPRIRQVGVLAMTGKLMNNEPAQAAAAGMDGFLSKPLNLDTLVREILRVKASAGARSDGGQT